MSEQVIDQNPTETASFDPFADHTYAQVGEPTLGQPHKRRRTSRVDTVLAQAKDVALAGIEQIAPKNTIGLLHHLRGEEDRLTTHLFECTLPGYRGWFWFATLARAPRSKVATVCEVGLLRCTRMRSLNPTLLLSHPKPAARAARRAVAPEKHRTGRT